MKRGPSPEDNYGGNYGCTTVMRGVPGLFWYLYWYWSRIIQLRLYQHRWRVDIKVVVEAEESSFSPQPWSHGWKWWQCSSWVRMSSLLDLTLLYNFRVLGDVGGGGVPDPFFWPRWYVKYQYCGDEVEVGVSDKHFVAVSMQIKLSTIRGGGGSIYFKPFSPG